MLEILNTELDKVRFLQSSLQEKIYKQEDLLGVDELSKRIYFNRSNSLNVYANELSDIKLTIKQKKSGFLGMFKGASEEKSRFTEAEQKYGNDVKRLKLCNDCLCSSCMFECPLKGCILCTPKKKVIACNKKDVVIFDKEGTITLFDNDRGCDSTFNVKGLIYVKQLDNTYLYLTDVNDIENEQLIGYKEDVRGLEKFMPLSQKEIDYVYNLYLQLVK
ncbi:hypothetical protein [uncultured Clostridium sp.]|uniref:hypothetical protein n=1 Tax=uncultured Clostridium sp. TaxID=59620 RepID=UPI002631BBE0|nr:hypothetical protein [uncultured Clostridium sp.]